MGLDLIVHADAMTPHRGVLLCGAAPYPCALGARGVTRGKREGDQATPVGAYPLRRLFYRPDVFAMPPETRLPAVAITPALGWCDDPAHPEYNRLVTLPFAAGHERLWRDDALYDLVVEIGYNDDPPHPGLGSAIFLHIARPDFSGTQGCVALRREDLVTVLAALEPGSRLVVSP